MSQPAVSSDVALGERLIEVVVPVFNEQRILAQSVSRLHTYLTLNLPYDFRIVIADNGSTDSTWEIACGLEQELTRVAAVHLDSKGKGLALKHVWSRSNAHVVAYMDVDLSTDLAAFLPLVAPLLTGHSDLAIGSRLARGSQVARGPKREFVSRTYNLMLRTALRAKFSDGQCGFKAGRTEIVQALIPGVADDAWFFDTELLLLAEHSGLRIHEVPVDWIDDPDSKVDIVRTAMEDLRGMCRVAGQAIRGRSPMLVPPRRLVIVPAEGALAVPATAAISPGSTLPTGMARQLPVFAVIGIASTLAFLGLYLLLRPITGAFTANALSLAVTTLANTAANRRFTFGVTGAHHALRDQLAGVITFLIALGLTTGALAAVHATTRHPSRPVELSALIGANALATVVRFVLLRAWMFHPRRWQPAAGQP